jgi:Rrf2 family protein
MKITATEEYGLRVLLRIASASDDGLSIPQLSTAEGLSEPYTAKLTRALRLAGFIRSTRGQKGGYVLAHAPAEIRISDVLSALDSNLFDEAFCASHTGVQKFCTRSVDCTVKTLWKKVQTAIDDVLRDVTLYDMIRDFPLQNWPLGENEKKIATFS